MIIFHIIDKTELENIEGSRYYKPASLENEGFIHCSRINQLVRVAQSHYKQRNGIFIMAIESTKAGSPVVFEDLYNLNEKYPHIYGPVEMTAVKNIYPMEETADGFLLPEKAVIECSKKIFTSEGFQSLITRAVPGDTLHISNFISDLLIERPLEKDLHFSEEDILNINNSAESILLLSRKDGRLDGLLYVKRKNKKEVYIRALYRTDFSGESMIAYLKDFETQNGCFDDEDLTFYTSNSFIKSLCVKHGLKTAKPNTPFSDYMPHKEDEK